MVALPVSSGEAQARIKTERDVRGLSERSREKPTEREETRSHDLDITTGHVVTPGGYRPGASAGIYPRRQGHLIDYSKGTFSHSVDIDYTDHETISLIVISSDSLKPWIRAAKDRVEVLTLGQDLVFRETEIIVSPIPRRRSDLKSFHSQDLDFYGETRTVAHEGTVGQKEKVDGFSRERWTDNSAMLLDHYCACVPIRLFFS